MSIAAGSRREQREPIAAEQEELGEVASSGFGGGAVGGLSAMEMGGMEAWRAG